MTGLSDVDARITSIEQLDSVVNALRGMSAARARQARNQIAAVDGHAAAIAQAIGSVLGRIRPGADTASGADVRTLVLFCAEQGFVGAFTERVLDAARERLRGARLLLVGSRGLALARERGIHPDWDAPMPSRSSGIPKLADRIAQAVYSPGARQRLGGLDAIFSRCRDDGSVEIAHRQLVPLDPHGFADLEGASPVLFNLAPEVLLAGFTADYVHAQLCNAALHAFAAENQARMQAMGQARDHIQRKLLELRAARQVIRQEEITAEIIELATGEMASHR